MVVKQPGSGGSRTAAAAPWRLRWPRSCRRRGTNEDCGSGNGSGSGCGGGGGALWHWSLLTPPLHLCCNSIRGPAGTHVSPIVSVRPTIIRTNITTVSRYRCRVRIVFFFKQISEQFLRFSPVFLIYLLPTPFRSSEDRSILGRAPRCRNRSRNHRRTCSGARFHTDTCFPQESRTVRTHASENDMLHASDSR